MNQNLINTNTGFPSLFHVTNANQTLTMPFTREIFLLDCYIAGTNFRPDIAEIEPNLNIGTKFRLRREPKNEHDSLATAIYTEQNYHLGYIPKSKNETIARLLDAGKNLSARLTEKKWKDSWLKLDIEIFLQD
jgi:HIRAN domain